MGCAAIDNLGNNYGNFGMNFSGINQHPYANNSLSLGSPYYNIHQGMNSPMSPGTQGFMEGAQFNLNIGGVQIEDCEDDFM